MSRYNITIKKRIEKRKMSKPIETVAWHKDAVVLIDQSCLPKQLLYIRCKSAKQVWQAIRTLKVRGAPAIGAAAALGMVLGINDKKYANFSVFKKRVNTLFDYFASARPTAVNLVWALKRMRKLVFRHKNKNIDEIKQLMLDEALLIIDEDKINCRKMANVGQCLIKDDDRILTYCNTGILATVDYGTALGVIYRARELKKRIKVYSCETRPLLQGARLTCWELSRSKIDVTLICDNMAGYLMQQKKIDKVFIGADRIARNGDVANKIGSYTLAVLARFHNIPFYVVAPFSTFDLSLKNGKAIPIEQRNPKEVSELFYKKPTVCAGVNIYNPAFDIVPANLITAIVSESALLRPPYEKSIKRFYLP